jgi:hypothetical protein
MKGFKADITLIFVIILANLVPLAGVIFLRWTVFSVVLLFWLESLIIGLFNVLRMAFASNQDPKSEKEKPASANVVLKLFLIPFFMVHFGGFMLIQGIFMLLFLSKEFRENLDVWSVLSKHIEQMFWVAVLILLFSHLIDFLRNYLFNRAYQTAILLKLMFKPYGRVFIQQFVIIGGVLLMQLYPDNFVFLILLIVLKIMVDLAGNSFPLTKLSN